MRKFLQDTNENTKLNQLMMRSVSKTEKFPVHNVCVKSFLLMKLDCRVSFVIGGKGDLVFWAYKDTSNVQKDHLTHIMFRAAA